jgi:hypothetical protein
VTFPAVLFSTGFVARRLQIAARPRSNRGDPCGAGSAKLVFLFSAVEVVGNSATVVSGRKMPKAKLNVSEVSSEAQFVVLRLRDLFITSEHRTSSAAILARAKIAAATNEEVAIYRQTREGWEHY